MTNTNPTLIPAESTSDKDRRKRRPIAAFLLATLAVGGIGAAVTSAAWTDNVFFSAPAAAATFNLQGSLDGTTWTESSSSDSIELVISADTFADLLPGESRTVDLWVRNQSTVDAALTSQVSFSGSTFTTDPTASVSGLTATLTSDGSGSSDRFQLTVTAPADWDASNQGKSATIVVTISATATS